MSLLQHSPNPKSQVLGVHPIELRLTQSTNERVIGSQARVRHSVPIRAEV
jgi:hypothetical protein